ncbi:RidA family protein [Yersinia frederiksenii]|uniref:RidA family protein n=1 Tax=Yersinia frederiksenii TaxID=29484 RepID=UPI0005E68A70|nr:RidA family protein [Yersinia frederiksenii]CNF17229.1 YjgF-family lipoprotein [Yersinia frederiksenii]
MAELIRKNYSTLGQVKGPYVHAVKHNETLYISGLTAFGTVSQGKSMAEQAEEIFSQFHRIASAENTSLHSLIKVTIFVTSLDGIEQLRAVLFHHFGAHLPASSLVQVTQLFSPEINVEIEAILALSI